MCVSKLRFEWPLYKIGSDIVIKCALDKHCGRLLERGEWRLARRAMIYKDFKVVNIVQICVPANEKVSVQTTS